MSHVWKRRLAVALIAYLFLSFTVGMVTKFWPGPTFFGPAYSVKFAEWGWPSWMRFVAGATEGICAVLLVVPRRRVRFLGAVALVFLLAGAVTTHLLDEAPLYEEVSAPLHLVIMMAVALANWPSDWRLLLRPWEPDASPLRTQDHMHVREDAYMP
ncbi:DoxX family protein [Actinomadura sp. 7K507]|uniref:DoxX family protein n=1 Tax=Actinomadura sp. 7K507 TaxID=2530365 RepID=UPI0010504818|nr:DoxX family protein [Actinomadura sp. 7K507]TDC90223.1 DoxX family protein [Actinomadura sp. 7K507]